MKRSKMWDSTKHRTQKVEADGINLRLGRKRKNVREGGCRRTDLCVIR